MVWSLYHWWSWPTILIQHSYETFLIGYVGLSEISLWSTHGEQCLHVYILGRGLYNWWPCTILIYIRFRLFKRACSSLPVNSVWRVHGVSIPWPNKNIQTNTIVLFEFLVWRCRAFHRIPGVHWCAAHNQLASWSHQLEHTALNNSFRHSNWEEPVACYDHDWWTGITLEMKRKHNINICRTLYHIDNITIHPSLCNISNMANRPISMQWYWTAWWTGHLES